MRVFVSHGSHDSWIARQMARCIAETGAQTLLDDFDMVTGQDFRTRIQVEIRQCDELVALLTPFSRRRTWLHNEIGLAWGLSKLIIPITYGMNISDLEREEEGGLGVLDSRHARNLNAFEAYLSELRQRIANV